MPVKVGKTDQELESIVMRKMIGPSYFKNIADFLEKQKSKEQPVPQRYTVEIMKKMTTILQEGLAKKQFQDISVVISAIQYAAGFTDHPAGLPLLLSNGVINLLAYVLDETQKFVSHSDGTEDDVSADSLMEVLLETINDVADFSEDAKKQAVSVFTEKLMKLIVSKKKMFHVRMEAIRTLNLLLEGCLNDVIQKVRDTPSNLKLMASMADLLTTAGDFEMQVACTESLARLVKRSDRCNYELIRGWLSDRDFAEAFMEIRDETFETDCRKFLNYVNESLGSNKSVFSLPCISAYLGSYKLSCPQDINLEDFWVDFNTSSSRITIYVAEEPEKENDEGGMWETVTIQKENVEKFYIAEKGAKQALFITLKVPASELFASCTSDDKQAHIIFDARLDVGSAAVAVFGHERFRRSKHKTSVSKINIQVHLDDSSSSPGPMRNIRSADESSDSVSLQNATIYGLGGCADEDQSGAPQTSKLIKTNVASEAPAKRKTSIPVSPMMTPTSLLLANNAPSLRGRVRSASAVESQATTASAKISVKPQPKKSEFTQPKTPVKPNSSSVKRVKTPLQIIVADKATDSGNESATSLQSIRSKKASISSGVSISSCGTPTRLRQKLQEVGAAQSQHRPSGLDDGKIVAGPSREVLQQSGIGQGRDTPGLPDGHHGDQIDGEKSPSPASNKATESWTRQDRHLRSRGHHHYPQDASSASNAGPSHQEQPKNRAGHTGVTQVSAGEGKDKTSRTSRKFRLYSDDGGMMMEPGGADKEVAETDLVIPSSIPTQESAVDTIPDSLPPSGRELPDKSAEFIDPRSRSNIGSRYPVAHSPSLSTLTEESIQSTHSKSSRTPTSITRGGETQTVKTSMLKNKIISFTLQQQTIEEVLPPKRVLRPRSGNKSPISVDEDGLEDHTDGKEICDRIQENEDGRTMGKNRNGKSDARKQSQSTDESSQDADDEEDDTTAASPANKEVSKSNQKSQRINDKKDVAYEKMTKTSKKSSKAVVEKPMPLAPSRAFRKVPTKSPETSQELSQLEFTTQMESHPKRGRPKKDVQKEEKRKRRPAGQGGKTAEEQPVVEEARPRARIQRAAAKVAKREILSLSQSVAPASDTSCNPTSQFESPGSTNGANKRAKAKNKTVDPTTRVAFSSNSKTLRKSTSPEERRQSVMSSQDSQDLSVYDFVESDQETSRSIDAGVKKSSHLGLTKKSATTRDKGRLLMSSQDAQDLSVYDFVDTDSVQESVRQHCHDKKKPSQPAKTVKKGIAQKKAPSKSHKNQAQSPKELSDIEHPRHSCNSKRQKSPKIHLPSPQELTDTDEQPASTASHRSEKKPRRPLPAGQEELSDIEQPRDAAPMGVGSRSGTTRSSREAEIDQYCDEDVSNFVESFANKQRQFLERGLQQTRNREALSEPVSKSRKGIREKGRSGSKAGKRTFPSGATMNNIVKEQRNKTPFGASAQSNRTQQHLSSSKTPKRKSTAKMSNTLPRSTQDLEAEIIDIESEEVVTGQNTGNVSSEDVPDVDAASVDNFSKMCQSMIKKSGRGLAATRTRRNIPKINYQQSSESESDEEEDEGSEQENYQPSSPEALCRSTRKRSDSDAVSERSWLSEKPKQQVSTYSKSHKKEWVLHTSIITNLDTTVKKARRRKASEEVVKRTQMPMTVPNKKKRASKRKIYNEEDDDDDGDSLGLCMYYFREDVASVSGSQLSQQAADKAQQNQSHRIDKTAKIMPISKSIPKSASTPSAVTETQRSSQDDKDESSIEIPREGHDGADDADICPLTPLALDDEIRSQILAEFATPKDLMKKPASVSSMCTSSSGKTPKQVTFDTEPNYAENLSPVLPLEDPLKSGPSSWVRPSSSALKRKYGDLLSEEEDEDGGDREDDDRDAEEMTAVAAAAAAAAVANSGQGALRPKKLFKGAISCSSVEEQDEEENGQLDDSDDGIASPSPPSQTTADLSALHITQMLKAVGENLKRKMLTKRTQTQQLTDGAVKTTQRHVSKLWTQQHQARNNAQEDFKNSLLTEIIALETDLSHFQDAYGKLQTLLEEHQRKVTSNLLQHVHRVKSLHNQRERDSWELEEQLGRHLLHNIKQILAQEMAGMQKKLIQDAQQHELQQMKKGLQVMFMS